MPFQQTVNITQAPAVEGQLASVSTSRHSVVTPAEGTWVAGTGGVTLGRFVWPDTTNGTTLLNAGTGAPRGIVANVLDALITTYLGEAGMGIPAGMPVGNVFDECDIWVKNTGSGAVTVGMKAFASNTTGQAQFAAAGATVAGYTESNFFADSPGAAGELIKISTR